MKYLETDDTFAFTNRYGDLRYEAAGVVVVVPELTNVVRVTRGGDLRRQTVDGTLDVYWGDLKFGEGAGAVAGTVAGGRLTASVKRSTRCRLVEAANQAILEPVSVPRASPLNPLQPVNRLTGLRPDRRLGGSRYDPLREAIAVLVKEQAGQFGLTVPSEPRDALIGEVLSDQRILDWNEHQVACWAIEYRRDELVARTWVRVSDGKVLKQEAFRKGETMSIVRDE